MTMKQPPIRVRVHIHMALQGTSPIWSPQNMALSMNSAIKLFKASCLTEFLYPDFRRVVPEGLQDSPISLFWDFGVLCTCCIETWNLRGIERLIICYKRMVPSLTPLTCPAQRSPSGKLTTQPKQIINMVHQEVST